MSTSTLDATASLDAALLASSIADLPDLEECFAGSPTGSSVDGDQDTLMLDVSARHAEGACIDPVLLFAPFAGGRQEGGGGWLSSRLRGCSLDEPPAAGAMRLLQFNELDGPVLTDFHGKLIPPYAILSHRWSTSETLFEDIFNGNYNQKEQGYQKLKFCAEQAAKDGLRYFWIDTCCIDKWDNNERSNAINSMFQWYRNAVRCYVFLSDVSLSAGIETAFCTDWETSFRASAWFTRGWTLQELIAPVSVEFFSCEGQRIGDKVSLERLLHEITGIPLAALQNSPLEQFSTSERMKWAEKRTTSEEEDRVYCVLGLLGVSVPAMYGEGTENALKRLQAELKATDSIPSIIPSARNESFVGREPQLAGLEAKLFSNNQDTTRLAIVGLGGTGKSQLALEVAHRTKQSNKDCSVFWIDAGDINSLYRSYARVAQKLRIPGCGDEADTEHLVKCCVAELSKRQCLLILNNIESTTVGPKSSSAGEADDLAGVLPHSKHCSVIFTTTESDLAETLAPRNVTVLHELTPKAALSMLQNRLKTPLSTIEQQEAMHLLRRLLYLPLAVVHAAVCMNASGMTLQQYQTQLDEHRATLKDSEDPSEDELRESELRNTVAATVSLSISKVGLSNAVAERCLCIAVCLDWRDIPFDLLTARHPHVREDAIRLLDEYALVTRRPAESAFNIHRLVHQALREQLRVRGKLRHWTQRAVNHLSQAYPNSDHTNRSKWRRLLPHAQHALSNNAMSGNNKQYLKLAQRCGMTLYHDGRYKEAEELLIQVVERRKKVFGDEHLKTLNSMSALSVIYQIQGRWEEAKDLEVQVSEIRKRELGNEHYNTLASLNNLAMAYDGLRRFDEAEELQVQVVERVKRVLCDEDPCTLGYMANLAVIYDKQGKTTKAMELIMQVMQTRKRVLGDKHPETLDSVRSLAMCYARQGQCEKAEELHLEVLQIRKQVLGQEHPDTLSSMHSLASTLWLQARCKEALALMETCLQLRQQVLGESHYNTQSSLRMLNDWRVELAGENS
ncbi:hypothetical protein OPT61_g10088 [Boeremia exigua]|uniref:Uncharacterized protein n=1 Tax=Boeremia exigua TaxID=749465 RepID=A0ACC2HRE9_9PLEO|nr:hypothetical protein OPT61_g10088 [Boeremia exigua]